MDIHLQVCYNENIRRESLLEDYDNKGVKFYEKQNAYRRALFAG